MLLDNLTFSPAMSALFLFYLALAVEGALAHVSSLWPGLGSPMLCRPLTASCHSKAEDRLPRRAAEWVEGACCRSLC